jgi:hypothetical protein
MPNKKSRAVASGLVFALTGLLTMIAIVAFSILQGGNLLSDPSVILIGPWFIVMMFDQNPVSIPIWIAVMVGAHLILRRGFQANT